ncbi:MAG: spermidine/putrescine ABC transporter substrate-binding protein, partial [Actinobacteria bacterium]|nr:spermidine/putrescine ABC transporter substrate-binding protein [Actinomycetota bacterium]
MKKDYESLSPETRALIRAQMTRRSLLIGAGAVVGAGTLAACGTGGTSSESEGVVDVSDDEKIVRWANWPLYLDFDEDKKEYPTLKKFEAATGITATYTEDIDDNNSFYGKVQGQLSIGSDIGYDIVTPTDWMAARWIEQGYAQELNAENIPNKANIREVLANVGFDPGRNYSLTWQSGFAGF